MDVREASELIRHTLVVALLISSPILVIGLLVGLIVSLVQAVTQIQEQAISFIPKTVAMVLVAILLMPWISHRLLEYTTTVFAGM